MDRSEWNRKVAISRWNKVINKEKEGILSNKEGILLKSAICGFLAGDGSIQIRNRGSFNEHRIDFFPDDKKMLKTYLKFIKKIYGKTPHLSRRDNVFTARINSKTIVEDLLKEAKFGIKKWEVPVNLLLSNEAKKYWLRAFFSAEGYVNDDVIKIQTVNKRGMTQVSDLLNNLSIKHGFYHYTPKKSNYSETHIIMINKKEARKKFYYDIGFWHSKKMQILKKSISA